MDSKSLKACSAETKELGLPNDHIPVLAKTLAEFIRLPKDGVFVDVTVGHGGHSRLFGEQMGPDGILVGLDVDAENIRRAQTMLTGLNCRFLLIRENFSKLCEVLSSKNIEKVDVILADLGFSSGQVSDPEKGMSFQLEAPLDMRLDDRLKITAADIVNQMDEKRLADLLYQYGQERASRKIARTIVNYRVKNKILSTGQLAALICKALHQPEFGRRSKIHPATRTFQALRIAVNSELENLMELLKMSPKLLKKGGMIAIISFHSLEDGIVKNDFRARKQQGEYELLTKKPITADESEIAENPRSRSAKLRIARKI